MATGAAVVTTTGAAVVAGGEETTTGDGDDVDEASTTIEVVEVEIDGRGILFCKLAMPAAGAVVEAGTAVGTWVAAPGVSVTVMVTTVTSISVTRTRLSKMGLATAPRAKAALIHKEFFILV